MDRWGVMWEGAGRSWGRWNPDQNTLYKNKYFQFQKKSAFFFFLAFCSSSSTSTIHVGQSTWGIRGTWEARGTWRKRERQGTRGELFLDVHLFCLFIIWTKQDFASPLIVRLLLRVQLSLAETVENPEAKPESINTVPVSASQAGCRI